MDEKKKARGFALMVDRERLRQIASAGGKKAQTSGKAHRWTVEECRVMGRKGGQATVANGTNRGGRRPKIEAA